MPSLVAALASDCVSWIQNPLASLAVTTPGTPVTDLPLYGETWLAPWTSWIRVPAWPLRGAGAATEKSAALLSVSAPPRTAAVVFDRFGVGEPSADEADGPYPTKSRTPGWVAQPVVQVSAVVLVTSATLPAVADMAIVPVTSGVGSAAPPEPPEDSATR